jgi:hypothetical protein
VFVGDKWLASYDDTQTFKWRKRIFLNFAFLADFTPFMAHTKKTSLKRKIASKFCHEMAACAKDQFLTIIQQIIGKNKSQICNHLGIRKSKNSPLSFNCIFFGLKKITLLQKIVCKFYLLGNVFTT